MLCMCAADSQSMAAATRRFGSNIPVTANLIATHARSHTFRVKRESKAQPRVNSYESKSFPNTSSRSEFQRLIRSAKHKWSSDSVAETDQR